MEYVPVEKGRHVLSIQEANIEIPGSPVDFYVGDEDEAIFIEGMGIEKAIAGQPAEFVITTKAARAQKLAVLIEGVARAKIVTREEGVSGIFYSFRYTYNQHRFPVLMILVSFRQISWLEHIKNVV